MGFQVMLYLLLTYDFDCLDVPEVEKRGNKGTGGGVEKYTMQLLTLWIIHQKGDEKKFRGYP